MFDPIKIIDFLSESGIQADELAVEVKHTKGDDKYLQVRVTVAVAHIGTFYRGFTVSREFLTDVAIDVNEYLAKTVKNEMEAGLCSSPVTTH